MTTLSSIANRFSPGDALLKRFLERSRTRRGSVSLPFELEYNHIYIIPGGFGLGFGFMLLFMALGGLNFNNNMVLLLVFLMGSIAQMTTLLAYRNLVGLSIDNIQADPVFAGEHAHFRIHLGNRSERDRWSVSAAFASEARGDCIDIKALDSGTLRLDQQTEQRGWLTMAPFRLETRFPMGLFKAWSWFFPEARCLVYPNPATHAPPLPKTGAGNQGKTRRGDGEQVHGLRNYREGDSLRRVAWRTSARHDQLYTREMESPRDESCILAWDRLPGLDTEERLAVLTAWVLQADHHQIVWSMELPGCSIAPGKGPDHRAHCLEQLAVFGL